MREHNFTLILTADPDEEAADVFFRLVLACSG